MAEQVTTNQFKNGMHIAVEGSVWRIIEFQHVKPGKGGAFVRTKLKGIDSGSVVDKTFRAGEKFERIRTEQKNMQFLYDAGDEVVFMDEASYEQITLARESVSDDVANARRDGTFVLISPVTTSTDGRCVASTRWMPTARAFCVIRTTASSTSRGAVIMRSASSSTMQRM